jgi:methylated-DNA-[protein]-cysteine S-methyltransferase
MNIQSDDTIFWSEVHTSFFEQRPFIIAATKKGLCHILWPGQPLAELERWANRHWNAIQLVKDEQITRSYVQQLQEYFQGKRTAFTVSLDLYGTSFQIAVWKALQQIAFGQTVSYGEIAEAIGNPRSVRAVGRAVGANPVPMVVPCHRVIGKNRTLTGFGGGLDTKKKLLHLEGVYIDAGQMRYQF